MVHNYTKINFGSIPVNDSKISKKSEKTNTVAKVACAVAAAGLSSIIAYFFLSRGKARNALSSIANSNRVTLRGKTPSNIVNQNFSGNTIPEEIFNQEVKGSDFLYKLKNSPEIFFWKNDAGTRAKVNLHEGSLLEKFKIVPIMSDDEVARKFEKVTKELKETVQKHFDEIGVTDIPVKYRDSIHGLVYDYLRCSNYKATETVNANITDEIYKNIINQKNNDFIRVVENQGWTWHFAERFCHGKSKYRMTLNAKVDSELIKSLDDFIKANNLAAKYKMPCDLYEACHRTDTFNIYFPDEPAQEIKKKICEIAQKYIRSDDGIGTRFAKGIFGQKEPSGDDVRDFIKICCAINPYLNKNISLRTFDIKYAAEKASAGQIEACKIILEKLLSA